MKKIIYVASFLLVLIGCNNPEEEANYPDCIKTQIDNFESVANYPVSTPRAHIDKYSYKGQIVYLINDQIGWADGAATVVNEKCESICLLGGIDGNQNDCVDWDKATFIETVWKDPR